MEYAMMTYTMARRGVTDMVEICRVARQVGLDVMDQVTLYKYTAGQVRRIADDHGIRIICYTFMAGLNAKDPAARRAGMDQVRQGLEDAAVLGACLVMVPISGSDQWDRSEAQRLVVEPLQQAVELSRAAGIRFSTEHFVGTSSPFIISDDFDRIHADVPDLWITFDSGNVVTGGEDPIHAFRKSLPRLAHVHFKDFVRTAEGRRPGLDGNRYEGALIGEGLIDYPALVREMGGSHYDGYVNIEYEGEAYPPAEAIRKALEYLRGLESPAWNRRVERHP